MRHGPAHHGTAGNHFARIGRQTTTVIQQFRNSRSNPNLQIGLADERRPRHRHNALYQRFVFLYCVIHRQRGTHILDNGSHIDGQAAARHLPSGQGRYQMLLAPLRILYLQGHDLHLGGRNGRKLPKRPDGFRLVVLYAVCMMLDWVTGTVLAIKMVFGVPTKQGRDCGIKVEAL